MADDVVRRRLLYEFRGKFIVSANELTGEEDKREVAVAREFYVRDAESR